MKMDFRREGRGFIVEFRLFGLRVKFSHKAGPSNDRMPDEYAAYV